MFKIKRPEECCSGLSALSFSNAAMELTKRAV
jgi:hypothetical protein